MQPDAEHPAQALEPAFRPGVAPGSEALATFVGALARFEGLAARRAAAAGPPRPYLLVTPLAMGHRAWLADELARRGVAVAARAAIRDWPRAATFVYLRSSTAESLLRAYAFEQLWRARCPAARGECWYLARERDHHALVRLKPAIRARLPSAGALVRLPQFTFRAGLHAVHVPDPGDLAREYVRLQWALRHDAGVSAAPDAGSAPVRPAPARTQRTISGTGGTAALTTVRHP